MATQAGGLLKSLSGLEGRSKMEKTKVISIVSPPFSGSTLLTWLLATHPEVATIGERKKFFLKVIKPMKGGSPHCSCGALFTDCEFWSAVKSKVAPGIESDIAALDFSNFQFYHNEALNRFVRRICISYAIKGRSEKMPAIFKGRFERMCKANASVIDAILKMADASVFVDSSKSVMQALFLSSISRFDTRIIQLVRDGRAQVCSELKRTKGLSIEDASERWASEIDYIDKMLARWPVDKYKLKYEELCKDPAGVMKELFVFCGLDPGPGSLEFRKFKQHIMGNYDMRSGKTEIIEDKQQWRDDLSPGQLKVFEKISGATNRALGYV